jgi:hypothetical protein
MSAVLSGISSSVTTRVSQVGGDSTTPAENSGLVVSQKNSTATVTVVWGHEDSGRASVIYAYDTSSPFTRLAAITPGTFFVNGDWEDIAIGPGPDGANDWIYIGNVGSGAANPKIARFKEPTVSVNQTLSTVTLANSDVEVFQYTRPAGQDDCEAFCVVPAGPDRGDIIIVNKKSGRTTRPQTDDVWRIPASQLVVPPGTPNNQVTVTPVLIGAIRTMQNTPTNDGGITACDISPDGRFFFINNYQEMWGWTRNVAGGQTMTQMLTAQPIGPVYQSWPGTAAVPGGAGAIASAWGSESVAVGKVKSTTQGNLAVQLWTMGEASQSLKTVDLTYTGSDNSTSTLTPTFKFYGFGISNNTPLEAGMAGNGDTAGGITGVGGTVPTVVLGDLKSPAFKVSASAALSNFYKTVVSGNKRHVGCYFKTPPVFTSASAVVRFSTAAVINAALSLQGSAAAGSIRIIDSANANVAASTAPAGTLTADTWYRLEFEIDQSGGAAAGIAKYTIYLGESDTVVYTYTSTATLALGTSHDRVQFGITASNTIEYRYSHIRIADTTGGEFGTAANEDLTVTDPGVPGAVYGRLMVGGVLRSVKLAWAKDRGVLRPVMSAQAGSANLGGGGGDPGGGGGGGGGGSNGLSTTLGFYNFGPNTDSLSYADSGFYPQVASTYYPSGQPQLNITAERARILRGTSPQLTLATVQLPATQNYVADLASNSPTQAALDWLNTYVQSLKTLSEIDTTVPVYAGWESEWLVKTRDGSLSGDNLIPANYGKAVSRFWTKCKQDAPLVKTTLWMSSAETEYAQAMAAATSYPDVFTADPYTVSLTYQSPMQTFQGFLDSMRTTGGAMKVQYDRLSAMAAAVNGISNYKIPMALSETGIAFVNKVQSTPRIANTDAEGVTWYNDLRPAITTAGLLYVVVFMKNSGPRGDFSVYDPDSFGNTYPLSRAAFGSAIAGGRTRT